ncbi:MAG TPA: Eco57I restriction-modification methylase domain-containing protein, partial [Ktedonobacteraceae bacterium]|nr:Eco57I restriction-modification methylase domain-containing protein [Ktedonobacteraceae bacterium]
PSCEFKTREQAMQEEVRLFRDILQERKQAVEQKLHALRQRATQSSLLDSSTHEDLERKKQIEEKENEHKTLERALRELISPKQVPFVWDIAFVEVMYSGDTLGFDIVIGNPPYVRQELISPPLLPRHEVTDENKREYKQKLAAIVYQDYPDFFQFHPGTGHIGHKINAQSDLYIYFYLHGLRLLNPKGAFCFITSNSWLDVAYGADLQEFLLKYCHIRMIIDNQGKRSFKTAAVNTVIALFSAPTAKPVDVTLHNIARFVLFTVDFEQILSADIFNAIEKTTARATTSTYRVYPIAQQTLLREGMEPLKEESDATYTPARSGKTGRAHLIKEAAAGYSSNKWGGKYLRAPDIYWTILEKGRGKLVRLGDIAEVRFGIKTGANEFFYLDEARAKQWHLEEEFLRPVIKSPRECRNILIDPTTLKSRLFLCHKTKEELKGKAALEYIKWGESQGYDRRPSCKGRAKWWDLGTQDSFDFVALRFRDKRNWNPVNTTPSLLAGDIMFVGTWHDRSSIGIYNAVANSTLSVLISEIYGRVNLGDGLLTTYGPEIQKFDFIMTSAFNEGARQNLLSKFKTLSNREVKSIFDEVKLPDRQDLDTVIFDVLDLTQDERDAVYKAVTDLVKVRQNKADSLNAPKSRASEERRKRLAAVDNTLGIWMGLPDVEEEEVDNTYA